MEEKVWNSNFSNNLEDYGDLSDTSIRKVGRGSFQPSRSVGPSNSYMSTPGPRTLGGRSSVSSAHSINLEIPRQPKNLRRLSIVSGLNFVGVKSPTVSVASPLGNLPEVIANLNFFLHSNCKHHCQINYIGPEAPVRSPITNVPFNAIPVCLSIDLFHHCLTSPSRTICNLEPG